MRPITTINRFKRVGSIAVCAVLLLHGAVTGAATQWNSIKVSTSAQLFAALSAASQTGTPTMIHVTPGHYRFTQSFDTGVGRSVLPPVHTKVFVVGTDADTTILDASATGGRFFTVFTGGWLVVRDLTLMRGSVRADNMFLGGGAVANFEGYILLDHCLLWGNSAFDEDGASGGAILSVMGRLELQGSTITNNEATGLGGGIAVSGGNALIHDSIISGNFASPPFEKGGDGGGIIIRGATVTIGNTTIAGNQAWDSGGGIFNAGTLWLSNSAVVENLAHHTDGGHPSFGGGITNGGLMRIKNGTVGGNSAGTFGGGIYNFNGGLLVLRGATIVRNDVFGDSDADGLPGSESCNTEPGDICFGGGGIWNSTARKAGTITAARTLIANNTFSFPTDALIQGPDCGGRILSEGYNALGNVSGCEFRRSYVLQGQPTHDQIAVDPRIGELQDTGDAGYAHFPLLPDSPLIDAGGGVSEICTVLDQIGQPRVDGNGDRVRACDIGAIEFQVP